MNQIIHKSKLPMNPSTQAHSLVSKSQTLSAFLNETLACDEHEQSYNLSVIDGVKAHTHGQCLFHWLLADMLLDCHSRIFATAYLLHLKHGKDRFLAYLADHGHIAEFENRFGDDYRTLTTKKNGRYMVLNEFSVPATTGILAVKKIRQQLTVQVLADRSLPPAKARQLQAFEETICAFYNLLGKQAAADPS
jgi:hypothetical protein